MSESMMMIPTKCDVSGDIVALACGSFHVLALNKKGRVYSWGSENKDGQVILWIGHNKLYEPDELRGEFDWKVGQIYAFENSSFMVTSENELWVWGSQGGNKPQMTPKKLSETPWNDNESNYSKPLVVGQKNQNNWIFCDLASNHGFDVLLQTISGESEGSLNPTEQIQYRNMKEKYEEYKTKYEELSKVFVGDSKIIKQELKRDLDKDEILPKLKSEVDILVEDIKFTADRIDKLDNEIKNTHNNLLEIESQLNQIQRKEEQLADSIQGYDNKNNTNSDRQKKTQEELYRANEQIKNMIQEKQKEQQEKKTQLEEQRQTLKDKKNKLEDKKRLNNLLIAERRETIAQKSINDTSGNVKQIISELYETAQEARKYMIEKSDSEAGNDDRNSGFQKGLVDLLKHSSYKLKELEYRIERLLESKISSSDAIFKDIDKIKQILIENLKLRSDINNYTCSLLLLSEYKVDNKIKDIIEENKRTIPVQINKSDSIKTSKQKLFNKVQDLTKLRNTVSVIQPQGQQQNRITVNEPMLFRQTQGGHY